MNDKNVVVIDFGTQGTVERTHQAILHELGEGSFRIKKMLLAHHQDDLEGSWGIFRGIKTRIQSYDPKKRDELLALEKETMRNVYGFLNETSKQNNTLGWLPQEKDSRGTYDSKIPFMMTLQEIGAGTASASGEFIVDPKKRRVRDYNLTLVSLQELFARFSFLEALNKQTQTQTEASRDLAVQRLNDFHSWFEKYPAIYGLATDIAERTDKDYVLADMINDANDMYKAEGKPPLAL